MKISCNSHSFNKYFSDGSMDALKWIDTCAALGFDGIEPVCIQFPDVSQPFLKSFKKHAIEKGMIIPCVSVGTVFTESDPKWMDQAERFLTAAHYLSAPILRVYAGEKEQSEDEANWNLMIKNLKDLTGQAEEKGIMVALEVHSGFTSSDYLRILNEVKSDWLKVMIDTGNFPANPYAGIDELLPVTVVMHTKFKSFDKDGNEATLDYLRIMELIKKHNYHGFLSIEYEGEGDPGTDVPKSIALLRKLTL